jgi:Gas vesicle protein
VSAREELARGREVALVDLVDRLMAGGVVLDGDLTLSIADVDLVHIALRAIIVSVATEEARHAVPSPARARPPA